MSNSETNRFLFENPGTLQSERLERAPSPRSMQVSGRSFEDLIKRSAEFAKDLIFYNDEYEPAGDWCPFFEKIYDYEKGCVRTAVLQQMMDSATVPPHLALMLGFFKLVLVEQESINTLTDRQMTFYFEQILGFRKRSSSEGRVTVFAELNKNARTVRIAGGTSFVAGKDDAGKVISYETIDENVVGSEDVDTLMYDDAGSIQVLFSGQKDFETSFALCFTSPILAHPACKRIVSFPDMGIGEENILKLLNAQYSAPSGWIDIPFEDKVWIIEPGMPEMVPPVPEIHGNCPTSQYPLIRFLAPQGFASLALIALDKFRKLSVEINDWAPETLASKFGLLENKPGVNPFGSKNREGDYFDVILKHPATGVSSSDPFEEGVKYVKTFNTEGDPSYIRYQLNTNDNCQEALSNKYSSAILKWMNDSKAADLKKIADSNLIAVTPMLSGPVIVSKAVFRDNALKCALQHPFGSGTWEAFPQSKAEYVLSKDESAVYLALTHVSKTSLQVGIYFEMNMLETLIPAQVRWEFYDGQSWQEFDISSILKDTTSGLSRCGICQFDIRNAVSETIFEAGLFWIRGVCDNGNARKVLSARSRALELAFSSQSAGKGPGGCSLPAGSISKPVLSIPGLRAVSQEMEGEEGVRSEDDQHFRTRVAEHLRHKGRAWSPWDYEALVLEHFPQIEYVRCLPACSASGSPSPGQVTIQVIPYSSSACLKPMVTAVQVADIQEMLTGVVSPFVKINVVSPSFTEIKVSAKIILRRGYTDTSQYEMLTNAALTDYFRPWIGRQGSGRHFSVGDGVSDIIAFLDALPFVDHVETPIEVIFGTKMVGLNGAIELSSPLEMITSTENHQISCRIAK